MTEYGLHIPPKVLIDTHIFLWLIDNDPRMPRAAMDAIYDRQNVVLLSHASVWELMIKAQTGNF